MNDKTAWSNFWLGLGGAVAAVVGVGIVSTFEWPDTESVQTGYRGNGMVQVYNQVALANQVAQTQFPEPEPVDEPFGIPASEFYENVQVLGHLDIADFNRLMVAITSWVAPEEQGCLYCHAEGEELSSDSLYTKRVARRMITMNMTVNQEWDAHVGDTGVTCYTCHRGQPVPAEIWFADPGQWRGTGIVGNPAGQNIAAPAAGLASLPLDPFSPYLEAEPANIRVAGDTALPTGNRTSIKQTEWTYSLMMHMSTSLGVNCTFCHNSRSFSDWEQSPPQRTNAWHGLRMVSSLNETYLEPLQPEYPAIRLGPTGDAPKVNCATCHQGAYKPLYGYSMIGDYPSLAAYGPPEMQDPPMAMPAADGTGGEAAPATSQ
ncbi:photosynthetic reaction center cytochrome PufC [Salinarimonas chemoclinalis]|uniref:photosynthetic reaction center cytochrome PufC n=1 Tax=Salinarimonas chemoclinalis TaxID=3241599 RepID=UPI003556906D